jgi:N-acetyl-gamma-glutamyl-phosphate reductase
LLKANLISADNIIIDAKSGVSGAGKQANQALMFCEISDNFFAYKVGQHQHTPEIDHALHSLSGQQTQVLLTTQMLPVSQGISMNIYTEACNKKSSDQDTSIAIQQAYDAAYKNYPFVKWVDLAQNDTAKNQQILSLKNVVGTANTHIGYFVNRQKITLFASIDNLLKGAASQAIENINTLFQLPIHTGLNTLRGGI